jgi:hypothetical protein
MERAWKAWDGWWFSEVDLRNVALLRIGFGLLALWMYVPIWRDLSWALADSGVFPLAERNAAYGPHRISLFANPWFQIADPATIQWLFVGFLGILVLVVLGVFSRVTVFLAWFFIVSMANRNAVWTDGSDVVLKIFGFYLLLMPTGRVWSVDAYRRGGAPLPASAWALRLFQLQVCILYVKTGLVKFFNGQWRSGEGVFQSVATEYFWRFPMEGLLSSPLFQWICEVMNWATLAFEIGFPLVFLHRMRHPMLIFGVFLHGGVVLLMNLGAFTESILWTYLAFLLLPIRK